MDLFFADFEAPIPSSSASTLHVTRRELKTRATYDMLLCRLASSFPLPSVSTPPCDAMENLRCALTRKHHVYAVMFAQAHIMRADAVVLTCGGYGHDREALLQEYVPQLAHLPTTNGGVYLQVSRPGITPSIELEGEARHGSFPLCMQTNKTLGTCGISSS